LRVLFVSLIPSYWGGSEVLWSQAALAMVRNGHQVSAFFALRRTAPQIDALLAAGVQIVAGTLPPLRWWRRLLRRNRTSQQIYLETLSKVSPDLVIFSQCAVRDGISEMLACETRGLPFAVINQLVEPLVYPVSFRQQVSQAYQAAQQVWFVSPENQESVESFLATKLSRAVCIPNAYACAYESELPWPESSEPLRLALVARLEPDQKGHDLVIEALADPCWRDRPITVSFFGDGPAREALMAMSRHHRLTDKVNFAGTAEPQEIWKNHHALIMPSRYEGQSLSMLEAMLHGRPVIAAPAGGTRGLVDEGETGFLAARADLPAWKEAMERAWLQRATWPLLGRAAAARVRAHVSPDTGAAMAERILALGPRLPHRPV
jgi:glycosyltransferase involved in cell wall biosynthesis